MADRPRSADLAIPLWIHVAMLAALAAGPCRAGSVVATADLVAPDDIVVVDAERTAAMVEAAGQRAPWVLRPVAGAADAVVASFEEEFRQARVRFVDGLRESFGREVLDTREIESLRFRQYQEAFRQADASFPVDLVLAQLWAKGIEGEGARRRLTTVLRAVMEDQLVGTVPANRVYLLAQVEEGASAASWSDLAAQAREVDGARIVIVAEAGRELRRRLESRDRANWGYLAGLLRDNVVEDAFLTGLAMRDRLGDNIEARAYARGEVIARAGQPLGRWGELALEHCRRMGAEIARRPNEVAVNGDPGVGGAIVERPDGVSIAFGVVLGGVALCGGTLAVAMVWRARRRRKDHGVLATVSRREAGPMQLALLPHLAREMKDRLVGALFAQRNALLENEAEASRRVAELEERLARLQPAIAEKIRGYERRIAALEQQLALKDRETQELIRAKLVLARQELEAEVQRNRIRWN